MEELFRRRHRLRSRLLFRRYPRRLLRFRLRPTLIGGLQQGQFRLQGPSVDHRLRLLGLLRRLRKLRCVLHADRSEDNGSFNFQRFPRKHRLCSPRARPRLPDQRGRVKGSTRRCTAPSRSSLISDLEGRLQCRRSLRRGQGSVWRMPQQPGQAQALEGSRPQLASRRWGLIPRQASPSTSTSLLRPR